MGAVFKPPAAPEEPSPSPSTARKVLRTLVASGRFLILRSSEDVSKETGADICYSRAVDILVEVGQVDISYVASGWRAGAGPGGHLFFPAIMG